MSKRLVLAVVFSLILASGFYLSDSAERKHEPKVALIVIDGGDWKPINQLREQDRVPHISRMMEEGVYGDLKTPKAYSPITWTKIGTGLKAEEINVDSWNVESEDGSRRMIQSSDVENKRIWDYLNEANISTGVTSYFLSWPVQEIDGFMVAGAMANSNEKLMYPPNRFDKDIVEEGNEWKIAEMVMEQELEDHTFHTLGFKRLDGLQHALWKFIEPEAFDMEREPEHDKYREIIYAEYENLDEVVSRFDDSWNVIVVSDSGFRPEGMYRAKSLEQFYSGDAPSGFSYATYNGDLSPLLRELELAEYETREANGEEITDFNSERSKLKWCPIDHPRPTYLNETSYTLRFCLLDNSIDVNQTIELLEEVEYRDGRKLFEDLRYNRERDSIVGRWRLYQDGVVDEKIEKTRSHQPTFHGKTYQVDKAIGLKLPNEENFKIWIGPEKSGAHKGGTHGIFIAQGPDIANKSELSPEVRAVDITPTILYMYNLPIPEKMNGKPVKQIFTREFNSKRDIKYVNVSTDLEQENYLEEVNKTRVEAMKEKLRGMGYLR